ncbi:aldehyde dehydrogenase family 3 member F1-like isoform X1 [Corylus avellana]|uniref:aldehyde dehydrogenase family 3 member F1-like isoform X1 n=1 Tax=Corylus avellana TaxID=13451 RepID=UPI00286B6F9B|nr:aldehyde dehydrogenase family 3 member F1-like isoform X1 [Corylus avellana]
METVRGLERDVEDLREYYRLGKTKEASWRKSQLKGLLTFLKEKDRDIFKVLKQDLGKHHIEAFRDEIGTLIKSLNLALGSLQEWMSGRKATLPQIALLTTAEVVPEPLGLVLIISSWNFPFGLSLEPLIGAIAAGNTVVLKPSELAPSCAAFLANNIPIYMDNNAVKVVQGGPAVGEQLLQQKWDKILFTGSARNGRLVMSAAVKHLTPVTLELGGKCPAIVDSLSSSWETKLAAKRILMAKCGSCAGQACIAIDYMLAEKKSTPTLVGYIKAMIKEMYGENPKESCSIGRIVNKHHFLRLKDLLNDPRVKASIVYGGSLDEDNLFIEPTILVDPPLEAAIMTEEIFGPLLPIITLENIEDSIQFINSMPKALAIYCFTKNKSLERRIISETSSGSITFNDALVQYAADTLPFGGVGESGMGRYHGKFSFDTFSHEKAILRRSFLTELWFRFPPWNTQKLQLLDCAYNYNYIGLLLVILGLKRSKRASYFN